MVDQPDAKSLVGGNVLSGHRQLFCPRQPDRFVERMNDLSETYIDLRLAEDRFLRRKPDVAERCKVESAGDGRTIHRSDHRLRQRPHTAKNPRRRLEVRKLLFSSPAHE